MIRIKKPGDLARRNKLAVFRACPYTRYMSAVCAWVRILVSSIQDGQSLARLQLLILLVS